MGSLPSAPDDALVQAAALAFAMVRFEEGAAHPPPWFTPPGQLKLGNEGWIFTPGRRPVPRDEVPRVLATLGSPALLFPTTVRGIVALMLVHELSGGRQRWAEQLLRSQMASVDEAIRRLDLPDQAPVVLQFSDEELVLPVAALRVWGRQFVVNMRWNLLRGDHESQAGARLVLYRCDGARSVGGACSIRRDRDEAT